MVISRKRFKLESCTVITIRKSQCDLLMTTLPMHLSDFWVTLAIAYLPKSNIFDNTA